MRGLRFLFESARTVRRTASPHKSLRGWLSRGLKITLRLELWVEESVPRLRRELPQAISPGFPESRKWRDSQARRYSSGTPPRYPARAFAARPQRPRAGYLGGVPEE